MCLRSIQSKFYMNRFRHLTPNGIHSNESLKLVFGEASSTIENVERQVRDQLVPFLFHRWYDTERENPTDIYSFRTKLLILKFINMRKKNTNNNMVARKKTKSHI